ncbi:HD-GYP domain, c-di-GMP phosphodiesterase class II (or its inactivated variant) [Deinococcus hopiensis KR-140]|uniref:HD-GYP domain, c-di-GMP phosphodiesterase class II (Or its inactivated variant) n=2 Tax=Deinococcus TaxID=1298 RepID=A0A1W1VC13_9DEIO|nr:HD-GYP domain, c-di-GMP phosphodiesterase class II (or its inactivated variant) [Deinococcus hopiensis KR-140]
MLIVLGLGALGYAARTDQQALLVGAALLLALVTAPLSGLPRWTALVAYPVAFIVSMLPPGLPLRPIDLAVALLVLTGLGILVLREGELNEELRWRRKTVQALQTASLGLVGASDAFGISRAAVDILDDLHVAPNVAFVAYRQGTPYILTARGAFSRYVGQPIHPSNNDSASVQADNWVAEEVLALLLREERRFFTVLPVEDRLEQHLGLLVLTSPLQPLTGEERAVVSSFAQLLASQLGQLQVIDELNEANDLTLRSLSSALEYRDDDTGGHTTRVVSLSVRLGHTLGWAEERVRALRWGAYLHDLGKLAIPDRILHKRGGLDSEERQIIQGHALLGYDLLQDLHFLPAETLDLVRYHHERWDGTGYPTGLRGHNIPEPARLFAIVDVYDALTNARPYKGAWTQERALEEIRLQAGRHFDPHYVEVFVRMMSEQDDASLVQ